ncbi:Diphthamide biosynthesis protein 2 [Recurvomyces mirabilis]|uniref:Diphthamide biosynthesis protein 2 n=1 Tax=Recurvomyces mirabilis TaxID=574656 RepID=UPI002DE1E992|nr:Diphthamide biosynthesis protein 2 [Recurvomyces mirabilis]
MAGSGPVLSTPAEHVFEDPTPLVPVPKARLTDEQVYLQYEVRRTVQEIREGRWKRIALQFPDEMLVDAPRVYERLREGLRYARLNARQRVPHSVDTLANDLSSTTIDKTIDGNQDWANLAESTASNEEKLTILADTSYGACCVDEVAAEHVDADVLVHYGRSCLSPTARLPVIYVYTSKLLDLDATIAIFKQLYPNQAERVCLVADIPFDHHISTLAERLQSEGYIHVFPTEIIHDPASLIPNRTVPSEAMNDPDKLREYSIFHVSTPPSSLLLILSSRVKATHILPTDTSSPETLEATTQPLLRRRYALVTRLASAGIFGILINTLSVKNYMTALSHCQELIRNAGKKSYVFVVGKVNAAKIANFSEIDGWVVIGCWESSLIESKEFYRPIITPFELEVALQSDDTRRWGSEWVGDFGTLLGREKNANGGGAQVDGSGSHGDEVTAGNTTGDWDEQESDDEPPEFDLRTGRYVSNSRPLGRVKPALTNSNTTGNGFTRFTAPPSSALVQRAKGDIATVNGAVSPAAEFLRSERTWQGLGSDFEIAYERDDEGKIQGAAIEEGRGGVAKGYAVGEDETKT